MKKIWARAFSTSASLSLSWTSSLRIIMPVVTVYLISFPPILIECLLSTRLSFGAGVSFFSSLFSAMKTPLFALIDQGIDFFFIPSRNICQLGRQFLCRDILLQFLLDGLQ